MTSEAANLEQLVLDRLKEHGLLDIAQLEVRVRQGVAYIKGVVPNLRQKRLAGEIAGKVDGVRDVVNMLRIAPSPIVGDDSLRRHISRALARNSMIDETKVSVEVINGVVHLSGFASTAAEKRLAEDEAWAAPGIRDIVNNIEVLTSAPKSDVQTADEILLGLSACLGLDQSDVTVELRDGVVHLRGIVPSGYLKSAAEELARWTPSVVDVVNELAVLSWSDAGGRSGPGRDRYVGLDCSVGIEAHP